MPTKPKAVILDSYDTQQQKRIEIADERGKFYFYLHDIVYLQGDGCYTTFYISDAQRTDKLLKVVTCHNLGHYKNLLKHGFAQANQRVIFNLKYLLSISRSYEVKLRCQHCLILVTRIYRAALQRLLR